MDLSIGLFSTGIFNFKCDWLWNLQKNHRLYCSTWTRSKFKSFNKHTFYNFIVFFSVSSFFSFQVLKISKIFLIWKFLSLYRIFLIGSERKPVIYNIYYYYIQLICILFLLKVISLFLPSKNDFVQIWINFLLSIQCGIFDNLPLIWGIQPNPFSRQTKKMK